MGAGRRRSPGFTLVEAVVVLGVVAVLASLGLNALSGARGRAAYVTGSNDLQVRLRQLHDEAFGHGAPVVFVLQRSTRRSWGVVDVYGDFDLASFNPAAPAPAPDRLVGRWQLDAPAVLGPSDGYGQALPTPFAGVPAGTDCTICTGDFGAVVFREDGTLEPTGTRPDAGSFTLQLPGRARRTFALVARTGAVQAFER
jgi:prepilin-type N-terminal cleavage/methylation domain-containing protein